MPRCAGLWLFSPRSSVSIRGKTCSAAGRRGLARGLRIPTRICRGASPRPCGAPGAGRFNNVAKVRVQAGAGGGAASAPPASLCSGPCPGLRQGFPFLYSPSWVLSANVRTALVLGRRWGRAVGNGASRFSLCRGGERLGDFLTSPAPPPGISSQPLLEPSMIITVNLPCFRT